MDDNSLEKLSELHQLVKECYTEGKYQEALIAAQQSVHLSGILLGEDDPYYAASINNVAGLYRAIGLYEKAEPLFIKAGKILKKALGENHPHYANCLNNLATLYESMGLYENARPLLEQALEIKRKELGAFHSDYAISLNNLASLYESMGLYEKAEPLYKQAGTILKKALGETHPDYAVSLNNLAVLYESMGLYEKAEPLFIKALDIRRNALGEFHPDCAYSLNGLAAFYTKRGMYKKAEQFYIQTLDMRKKALGESHPDYATSLNNLASLYKSMGLFEKAEPLLRQALDIRRKTLGETHPDYAASLNNLSMLYESLGQFEKAKPLLEQALAIQKRVLGESHPDYATGLNNLAGLYKSMGLFEKAEPLLRQVLDIRRNRLGELHSDYASSLKELAALYELMGMYRRAEPLYIQSIEIQRKVLGESHPNYVASINNLAGLYVSMGLLDKAEPLYKQSLEMRRRSQGESHPDFAISLNNLAGLYTTMGLFDKAEPLYKQSLEMRRRSQGESHPDFAISLNSLAGLYKSMGLFDKAAPLLTQALGIQHKALNKNHPDLAISLNNQGELYESMGMYEKAEPLLRQALDIQRKTLGESHPHYAVTLNSLAILYRSMSLFEKAMPLFAQALEITRKSLGEDHYSFALSLNNLATMYESMGLFEQAEPLHVQAIDILGKTLGESHPDFGTNINNLAGMYKAMGIYDKAELLYQRVIDIQKKTLGEDNPYFANSLNNMATLCAAIGRIDESLKLMKHAAAIEDRIIGRVFSISSENQQLSYLSSIQSNMSLFVSLVSRYFSQSPEAIHAVFSHVLKRKGITAELLAIQRATILKGKYPHLREKLLRLDALRMQIARHSLTGPGKDGLRNHKRTLAKWDSEKEHLERELTRLIPEMRLEQNLQKNVWSVISHNLTAENILVEFYRYDVFSFTAVPVKAESQWEPARYCAFVLRPGQPQNITLIDMGDAGRMDMLNESYKSKLAGGGRVQSKVDHSAHLIKKRNGIFSWLLRRKDSNREQRSRLVQMVIPDQKTSDMHVNVGLHLYFTLIAPLKSAIGNCRHLVIAPDSQLSLIPFEVIPMPEGGYLVDQYRISYVGVGRDIYRFNTQTQGISGQAVVMASPDFNLQAGRKQNKTKAFNGNGRRSRDLVDSSEPFPPLMGAKLEGENIAKLLDIKPLLEKEALEGRLKSVSSPHILHIATHGFFLEDQKMPANKANMGLTMPGEMGMQRLSGAGIENPMLRSGLVLAGVNTWMKHGELPPEAEDGILTAEDVTALDLTNTNLVVLSACDTGLGDVKVGEGVFGLRRAFTIAGAKTLVMSLWKVPDTCTQELMEDFYRRILAGTPKAEALREAQIKLREKYPHPRDWGGFICQGDPGPIPMYKIPPQ